METRGAGYNAKWRGKYQQPVVAAWGKIEPVMEGWEGRVGKGVMWEENELVIVRKGGEGAGYGGS